MEWRLAKSLEKLRTQINSEWPNRNKASDGTIGDARHATSTSDHNPWVPDPPGPNVVTALDITHDPAHGVDNNKIVSQLVASRDRRIKYIIWNRRIISSTVSPWTWRPYTGTNPHDHHFHVSVLPNKDRYDDASNWRITAPPKPKWVWVLKTDDGKIHDESAPFGAAGAVARYMTFSARVAGLYVRLVKERRGPKIRRVRVTGES